MSITLNQKYVKVVKGGVTYNCKSVNVIKNGVTYNVWGGGRLVTYIVDNDVAYTEEVTKGKSVLSPTTFTPTKNGYTFVGWREDDTASSSVLNSKTMGDSPITLFAVFKQTITLKYLGNGATGGNGMTQQGTRYYNASGNAKNPTFTLPANRFTNTDHTFYKWALDSPLGTQYAVGEKVTLSENSNFYAVWKAHIYWIKTTSSSTEVTSGYPTEWTMTEYCCDDMNYVSGSYKKDIYSINPTCNNHTAHFKGTASGSTGGRKYAVIYLTQMDSKNTLVANGTTITRTGTYTIDVSNTSMLNLTLTASGPIYINYIKFYD